jgi:hypothetical protein
MIKSNSLRSSLICHVFIILFLVLPGLISAQEQPVSSEQLLVHQKQRQEIIINMQKVMGKLPQRPAFKNSDVQIVDSLIEPGFTRYNINYTVAKDEIVPVYLYVPHQKGTPERLPAMLVLHGTHALGNEVVDGQGDKPNRTHARELAQRGYVV